MKIHFIYRAAPGDSKSDKRPAYFDKLTCLNSFINSFEKLDASNKGDLIFLNDGEIHQEWLERMLQCSDAEVINLGGVGNSLSLKEAYKIFFKKNWDDGDVIYFCEDDYLHLPEAFEFLINAVKDIPQAEYFTLYDHLDRYTRNDDADGGRSKIYVSRDCHWRTVESGCQTYGVRIRALKKDIWIHKLGLVGKIPRGREMFRAVQGLGKYFFRYPKRKMVSPIPALCTHMETEFLSPNIDWEEYNTKLKSQFIG